MSSVTTLAVDSATIVGAEPGRKFLYFLFCLAIKETASEIRIEPTREELKLSLQVQGKWYEMVPLPSELAQFVIHEFRRVAGLSTLRRLVHVIQRLGRHLIGDHSLKPFVGRIRLDFPNTTTELSIALEDAPFGPRVTVKLPEHDLPAGVAKQILQDYLRQCRADPSWLSLSDE